MKTILLIEDNSLLAENIKALLEEEIFSVIHVSSAEEGLNIVFQDKPDLILCDIMLPDKDGYELLQILKDKLGYSLPPFVYLTAKSQRDDQRKGMELGADDFITKPFTKSELLNAINTQLNKREKLTGNEGSAESKTQILNQADDDLGGDNKLSYNGFIFLNEKKSPGFFAVKKIIYIKSLKDYTTIVFNDFRKVVIRRTLAKWEEILPAENFVRIHRQTIINLQFLDRVERDKNYTYRVYLKLIDIPFKMSQRYSRKIKKLK
ncbi:MAG: response regulator [Bacteroidetes bacterium]|nr:response regulator [Bacteroidota bacterium]